MFLLKRLTSSAHYSGIEYALALHARNEVRRDGLTLTKTSSQLVIEWRARDVHPWDRDPGCSLRRKSDRSTSSASLTQRLQSAACLLHCQPSMRFSSE